MGVLRMKDIPETVELVGDRIVLRAPPVSTYNDQAKTFYSQPENMEHLPFFAKQWTNEEIEQRRNSQRKNQENQKALNFDIFWKNSDKLIGIGGFRIIDKESSSGEFGIILDHSVWRKGISVEAHLLFLGYAIEELGIETLHAGTSANNTPMKTFFDKFGIKFHHRTFDNGCDWDVYQFQASTECEIIKEKMQSAKSNSLTN